MASKNIIDLTKDSFDGEVLKSEHPVLVDFFGQPGAVRAG